MDTCIGGRTCLGYMCCTTITPGSNFATRFGKGRSRVRDILRLQDFSSRGRGFGKVWREQLGGPQARIGWATDKERGFYSQVLAFERGEMLHAEGRVYVLYRDSVTWRQFAP